MPYINMKTSAKLDTGAAEALKKAFGEAITLIPGKTERWLMINIEDGCDMAFAGDFKSGCAMLEVELFGAAKNEAYDSLTKRLCDVVSEKTGVSPNRIYVKYAEVGHWGYNGFNF